MKLSRIYSNIKEFKSVDFQPGLNVIYGDVKKEIKAWKVTEHNIWKSSLVELLDFMLLKEVSKDGFFGRFKKEFIWYVFFLEIQLNTGKFLTIKRSVDNNTKISFKSHNSWLQNFVKESKWDYEDLLLWSKKENPKDILANMYLKFEVNTDYPYRSFLSFLLRTQNDYQEVFRLSKFRWKDVAWKPNLFDVLWFDAGILTKKYHLSDEVVTDKKYRDRLSKNSIDENEIYKVRAFIESKQEEKSELEKKVDEFDFYKKEKKDNYKIVNDIEAQIATYNTDRYNITKNIERVKKAIDSWKWSHVDLEKIKEIYSDVQLHFPSELLKNYEDVVKFSNQITSERNIYLKEELKELESKLNDIEENLRTLNDKRKSIFSWITKTDSFVKYKEYKDQISKLEQEIFILENKEKWLNQIEYLNEQIEIKEYEIKELGSSLKKEINKENKDFTNIKKIFKEIYRHTFEFTALIILQPNGQDNIDFKSIVVDEAKVSTGKWEWYTSIKVMSACFVLAVLCNYYNKSFFRFAYHDWILESWWNDHKTAFIENVRLLCDQYDIQYIISVIESDVPDDLSFSDEEIVLRLSKGNTLFWKEW